MDEKVKKSMPEFVLGAVDKMLVDAYDILTNTNCSEKKIVKYSQNTKDRSLPGINIVSLDHTYSQEHSNVISHELSMSSHGKMNELDKGFDKQQNDKLGDEYPPSTTDKNTKSIIDSILTTLINDSLLFVDELQKTKNRPSIMGNHSKSNGLCDAEAIVRNLLDIVCGKQINGHRTNVEKESITMDHNYATFCNEKSHNIIENQMSSDDDNSVNEVIQNLISNVCTSIDEKDRSNVILFQNCSVQSGVIEADHNYVFHFKEDEVVSAEKNAKEEMNDETVIRGLVSDLCGIIDIHSDDFDKNSHIDKMESVETESPVSEIAQNTKVNTSKKSSALNKNQSKIRSKRKSAPVKYAISCLKKPRILITRKQVRNLPSVVVKTLVESRNQSGNNDNVEDSCCAHCPDLEQDCSVLHNCKPSEKDFDVNEMSGKAKKESTHNNSAQTEQIEIKRPKLNNRKSQSPTIKSVALFRKWKQELRSKVARLRKTHNCKKIIVSVQIDNGDFLPLPNKSLDLNLQMNENFCIFLEKTKSIYVECTILDVDNGFNSIKHNILIQPYRYHHIKSKMLLDICRLKREILLRQNNTVEVLVALVETSKDEMLPTQGGPDICISLPNDNRKLKFIEKIGGTFFYSRFSKTHKNEQLRKTSTNHMLRKKINHMIESNTRELSEYTGEFVDEEDLDNFSSNESSASNIHGKVCSSESTEPKSCESEGIDVNPKVATSDAKLRSDYAVNGRVLKISIPEKRSCTSLVQEKKSENDLPKKVANLLLKKQAEKISNSDMELISSIEKKDISFSLDKVDNHLPLKKSPVVLLKRENLSSMSSPICKSRYDTLASKIIYSQGPLMFHEENKEKRCITPHRGDKRSPCKNSQKISPKLEPFNAEKNKNNFGSKNLPMIKNSNTSTRNISSNKLVHNKNISASGPCRIKRTFANDVTSNGTPQRVVRKVLPEDSIERKPTYATPRRKCRVADSTKYTPGRTVKSFNAKYGKETSKSPSCESTFQKHTAITSKFASTSSESGSNSSSGDILPLKHSQITACGDSLFQNENKVKYTSNPNIGIHNRALNHIGATNNKSNILKRNDMTNPGHKQKTEFCKKTKDTPNETISVPSPLHYIPKLSHILASFDTKVTTCCFCHLPANHLLGLGDLFGPYRPLAEEVLARHDCFNEHQKQSQLGDTDDLAHAAKGSPHVTIDKEEAICFLTARTEEDCTTVVGSTVKDLSDTIEKSSHRLRTLSTVEHILQDSGNLSWQKKQKVVHKLGSPTLRIPGPKNECKIIPSDKFDSKMRHGPERSQSDEVLPNINSIVFLEPKITLPHGESDLGSPRQRTPTSNSRSPQSNLSSPARSSRKRPRTPVSPSFNENLPEQQGDSTSVCINHKFNTSTLWVHGNCALWADGVYAIRGQLYGLWDAARTSSQILCHLCNRTGATIVTREDKMHSRFNQTPLKAYHYPCSTAANIKLNWENLTANIF